MNKADGFLSRRKLLLVLGGVAGAAGAAMLTPFRTVLTRNARAIVSRQPALRRALLSMADASYEEWLDLVGSVFTVGGGTSMKLTGVRAFAEGDSRPMRLARDRAFVAVFDVQNGGTMAGDLIYTASHSQLGALRIFLSAAPDPRTPGRMMAVFN